MSSEKHVPKTLAAVIIIVAVVAAAGAAYHFYETGNNNAHEKEVIISPPNPTTLVDMGNMGYISTPDALDPSTGFSILDGPIYTAVYQPLVMYNGSSLTQLVPVLAQSWTMEPNGSTYVFIMRNDAYFSNGDPINATTAWFSLYRTVVMGQAPGVSDYEGLIANFEGPYFLPVGARHAVQSAFHLSSLPSPNQTAAILSQVLSNFNVHNSTIEALMSYPHQSVVVLNDSAIEFNLVEPYRWFAYDLASSYWGAIADPSFVDAHGGVQAGQPNSYIDTNGMVGSGPYVISSVGSGMSSVTLKANPNYWAATAKNVPWVISPARIPNVIIEYGASHTDRVEEFDTNQAQLSYVSIPSFNTIYQGYEYKGVPFSAIFNNQGMQASVTTINMNCQIFPTNITDFRLALVHAINYSAIISSIYTYNGTPLAQMYVGPITPDMPYYDPQHLPPYSFNLSMALQYINEAGKQGDFYVILPNGTLLGNPSGKQLPPLSLYTSPPTPSEQTEFEIIQKDLSMIGVSLSLYPISPSATLSWTTAQATPALTWGGWLPDWSDPIYQQLVAMTDISFGDAGNYAWLNNTQINSIDNSLPWTVSQQQQLAGVEQVYNLTYQLAPYVWLPQSYTWWFQQPYLRGVVFNPFLGYYYNLMYYSNYTA
ncbi:ABC transporter substrate-binding protein [Tardisphaera miroshnichenkoae]